MIQRLKLQVQTLLKNKDNFNLLKNIFFAFLIKGASLLISVFSMPLYIQYFDNDEALGLWYTLLSLLSWVLICDLGLGNGLRNKLTEALALKDMGRCKKLISSTYAMMSAVIIPVLLIGIIAIPFLNLNIFFNISTDKISASALRTSFTILFTGICISFILKAINSIVYALQKSAINNFLSLVTSVLPLIYISVFQGTDVDSNLIALSYVHALSINLPLLVTTVVLFLRGTLKACRPSLKSVEFSTAKQMLSLGMLFFITQIFFMFLSNTNEIILTKVYTSEVVVDYSIYYKLFTIIGSLFMLALTPLWSKVTKDLTEKKYGSLIKTNRVLLGISLLAALAEFAIIPILQWGINLWLQEEAITVDYGTAFIFAFYGSTYILNVVLTTLANGLGKLKTQVVFYGIGSVLKIPAAILLEKVTGRWDTVVLYNAVVLLVFCIFQYFWINRSLISFVKEKQNEDPIPNIE